MLYNCKINTYYWVFEAKSLIEFLFFNNVTVSFQIANYLADCCKRLPEVDESKWLPAVQPWAVLGKLPYGVIAPVMLQGATGGSGKEIGILGVDADKIPGIEKSLHCLKSRVFHLMTIQISGTLNLYRKILQYFVTLVITQHFEIT